MAVSLRLVSLLLLVVLLQTLAVDSKPAYKKGKHGTTRTYREVLDRKKLNVNHFKEKSRAAATQLRHTGATSAGKILTQEAKGEQTDGIMLAQDCSSNFKFTYVFPGTEVRFLSPKKSGTYPNDLSCGWWFWTEPEYILKVNCELINIKSDDFMFFEDMDNDVHTDYTNGKKTEFEVPLTITDDLVVGLDTNAETGGKGFKCVIRTEPAPLNRNCQCGVSPTKRIVGGTESGDFPWMVAMKLRESEDDIECSAVIVASEYLLTSAICAISYPIAIYGGLNNPGVTTQVLEVIPHPDFEVSTYSAKYNVALLKVEPITFNSTVSPICLPDDLTKTYDGVTATIAGYGGYQEDVPHGHSDVLREADVSIISNALCAPAFAPTPLTGTITSEILCASDPTGAAYPCHHDWGGPMMVTDGANVELAAVLSGAVRCHFNTPIPDIYIRVTEVTSWIQSVVGADHFCPRTI